MSHRPVEPADLFRFKFLQSGDLSPDGSRVVYGVSHVAPDKDDAKKNDEYITLWLHSLESGECRQLTSGKYGDSDPRWSPDGKSIAFVSARDGKPQIYVMPVDGGEPRAITEFKQGVGGNIAWSPDGSKIAFAANPLVEQPDASLPYRVTRSVYRFNGMGYLDTIVQDIYVVSVETGETVRLTEDKNNNGAPQWSPDGQEILFVSMMRPDGNKPFGELRIVNLSGEVRDVVTDAWGAVHAASWLPDGRIVFLGLPKERRIGGKSDLWVVSAEGGEPECRTAGHFFGLGGGLQADMPVFALGSFRPVVTGDGKFAYSVVQRGGIVEIVRVALDGDESVETVITGERDNSILNVHEKGILFAANTLFEPPNLFFANTDGSDERRLTSINADFLAQLQLPTLEHLEFKGKDGVPVEGWILKPAVGEAPYPTVLYIHGGPHSGFGHTFSFDFHMLAGAGYAVLFINQRGSTGYGDEFAQQIIGDWGNHDYHDLMAGVDYAIEKGIADADRLGVCGLSGGGNLSTWIVGQTDRFKAAVPENPVTNWVSFYGVSDIGVWFATSELGGSPYEIPEVYARCSPITYANRCKTPTLLIQGEHDWRCPPEQSEQFYTVLRAHGCEVEMVRFPSSAHAESIGGSLPVRTAHNDALLDWMRRHIPVEKA